MYLKKGVDKPERNDDGGEHGSGMEIFKQNARLFSPISRAPSPSKKERELAHWFVLYNSPEVDPYLEYVVRFDYVSLTVYKFFSSHLSHLCFTFL